MLQFLFIKMINCVMTITIMWLVTRTLLNHTDHSCHHNLILLNHVTLPGHIPEPVHTLTCALTPIHCAAFLWPTPTNMCSHFCAQSPAWNYIHAYTYLVFYPLWSYAPMLPPCYMFPLIWLMLPFPVAPWLALILLQVLIPVRATLGAARSELPW